MSEVLKKYWLIYLLELIFAIIIINWDLKIFLVYAFLMIIFKIDTSVNFLRKLIRVFQVTNEVRFISIQKKLKVKAEDTENIVKETEAKLTEEDLKQLNQDIADLIGK